MKSNIQYPIKYKGAQLHPPDILSLQPKQWLTAEALYFGILQTTNITSNILTILDPSLATFILFENDFEDLITIKSQLENYQYILTAINDSNGGTGSHWGTLLFHNFIFTLFDSSDNNQLYINAIEIGKKIISILKDDEQYLKNKIEIQQFKNIQKQTNNYDCGIYSIAIIKILSDQIQEGKKEYNLQNITPQNISTLRIQLNNALNQLK